MGNWGRSTTWPNAVVTDGPWPVNDRQDLDQSVTAPQRRRRPADQQLARLRIAEPLDHVALRPDARFEVQQAGGRQTLGERVGIAHQGDNVPAARHEQFAAAHWHTGAARTAGKIDDPLGGVP